MQVLLRELFRDERLKKKSFHITSVFFVDLQAASEEEDGLDENRLVLLLQLIRALVDADE